MPERRDDDPQLGALAGRRVLVTGHSGFKGGWLCLWLESLGAQVIGISLPPPTGPSFFASARIDELVDSRFADIRDADALAASAGGADVELVFHLAAQPVVRLSHRAPAATFATNVVGTAHVLDLVRRMPSLRAVIVVTSDKCYDNAEVTGAEVTGAEWPWPYRETDRLGGSDPYSASKACTEIVAECYRRTWFSAPGGPQLATVRAGNVIGGGDWAEDRLVPDIVRAASAGTPLLIRNPRSIRPWQHVLEALSGYLQLGARLLLDNSSRFSGAWNFGPSGDHPVDVEALTRAIMQCSPKLNLPIRLGAERGAPREAVTLRLDSSKAHQKLGWWPRLSGPAALALTADWYAAFLAGNSDMRAISRDQLAAYTGLGDSAQERQAICA